MYEYRQMFNNVIYAIIIQYVQVSRSGFGKLAERVLFCEGGVSSYPFARCEDRPSFEERGIDV
jgi:hypothetical protein